MSAWSDVHVKMDLFGRPTTRISRTRLRNDIDRIVVEFERMKIETREQREAIVSLANEINVLKEQRNGPTPDRVPVTQKCSRSRHASSAGPKRPNDEEFLLYTKV